MKDNATLDAQALDRLAQLLRRDTWPGADMLEWIAEIVATRRDIINGPPDEDYNPDETIGCNY